MYTNLCFFPNGFILKHTQYYFVHVIGICKSQGFKFHGKHFLGSVSWDHGNGHPSETIFRFRKNKSWEPISYTIIALDYRKAMQIGLTGRQEGNVLFNDALNTFYCYMVSYIWLRTILIVRKETRCRHIGYSLRLTSRVLLYAPSHRQDSTYHGLCYTSRGALAGTRNSSMGSPHEGSIWRPIAPWANALTTELHLAPGLTDLNLANSYIYINCNTMTWLWDPKFSYNILNNLISLQSLSLWLLLSDWCNVIWYNFNPVCCVMWVGVGPKHRSGFFGSRCSSVVRAFAHGAMGRRIDPS